MSRLRYGDWICGLGTLALLVLLFAVDDGWGAIGWLTSAFAVVAIVAGFAMPLLTILRASPSAPLLSAIVALLSGIAATVGLLVDGAGLALTGAVVLVIGAYLGLHDERQPGAPEIPVERRPAPQ